MVRKWAKEEARKNKEWNDEYAYPTSPNYDEHYGELLEEDPKVIQGFDLIDWVINIIQTNYRRIKNGVKEYANNREAEHEY